MTILDVTVRATPLKARQAIHLPRWKINLLEGPANIISIEYFSEERPYFDSDKTVLALNSVDDGWIQDTVLASFLEQIQHGPVYVHCEYGQYRSKAVVDRLVRNFGYTARQQVAVPLADGSSIQLTAGDTD